MNRTSTVDGKRGPRGTRFALACLGAVLAVGCSHSPWPDEPGVPVELARSANLETADAFFASLTSRRQEKNLPPPITTPRHQDDIRPFAEDLQAGKLSAVSAERAVERWARAVYGREVKTYALDCATAASMTLPESLVTTPNLVIAYAAAHFRPRSLATNQCVILLAQVLGTEHVEQVKM